MRLEEYAAAQAVISGSAARYAQQFGAFFLKNVALSLVEWLQLLHLLFPEVERRRRESADLARGFYDAQRRTHVPELPRNDIPLEGTSFEKFVENMEPVRRALAREATRESAPTRLALEVAREVENAGRRQMIHAVEQDQQLEELITRFRGRDPEPEPPREAEVFDFEDARRRRDLRELLERYEFGQSPTPEPDFEPAPPARLVRGWARVATGRETCAWCLMLVSRGPVYQSAETAGLDLSDDDAIDMLHSNEDVSQFMKQWHPGCDCKVVPVFKVETWPGRDAWKRAEQMWIKAGKEAARLIKSGEAATDNVNRETQKALRRLLERGEIDPSEFAAFAA